MKTIQSVSGFRGSTRGKRFALSRRATFLFAIVGAAGLASTSSPARAEPRARKLRLEDLKAVGPDHQVVTIRHHGNSFEVVTADGRSKNVPDVYLHFKIDASEYGPRPGKPIILPGGMIGDRATVFVASPAELGALIEL